MDDCLLVGGGVIGLTLAYQLAGAGRRVRILDQSAPGRAASWAGAGLLPPAPRHPKNPVEEFAAWSNQLHVELAAELQQATGIDTGYRRSGAVYIARSAAAADELRANIADEDNSPSRPKKLSANEIRQLEPAIDPKTILAAYEQPDECQLRNPRHLRALEIACRQRGVTIVADTPVMNFEIRGGEIESVQTTAGAFRAEQYCITAGAWAARLAEQIGLRLSVKPIRGQIALLSLPHPIFKRIINEGPRYLVPRDDGHVLVGSTMEDVGFNLETTPAAIDDLVRFARELVPALTDATLEASWSGLRPMSADGNPYLGRVPTFDNCFVAAGHARAGIVLSPATAVVMTRLMSGEEPGIDITPFRIER